MNKFYLTLLLAFSAATGFANNPPARGPAISGGGTSPEPYIYDKTALLTILAEQSVTTALRNTGRIVSILPGVGGGTFVIKTESCELTAIFSARRRGQDPGYDFYASIVRLDGNCSKE